MYRIMIQVIDLATKTNAVRLAEQSGIPCHEYFYDYDPDDLNGNHAAQAIELPPEQVYKTLVAKGSRTGINVFCIPVCAELDLKKAAKAAGDKDMALIPVKDLLTLTGYIRGGCSPVGMKKKYPTYIEESCELFDQIIVSAGERGHMMAIPTLSLLNLVDGQLADIIV